MASTSTVRGFQSNIPLSLTFPQVDHPVSLSPHHCVPRPRRAPLRPGRPHQVAPLLLRCHDTLVIPLSTQGLKGEASPKLHHSVGARSRFQGLLRWTGATKTAKLRGRSVRVLIYELRGIVDFVVHDNVEILSTHQIRSAPNFSALDCRPRTFFPL